MKMDALIMANITANSAAKACQPFSAFSSKLLRQMYSTMPQDAANISAMLMRSPSVTVTVHTLPAVSREESAPETVL